MSDPVKNVEIEDVLSSIRRLLADGEGAAGSRPAAAPKPEQAGPRQPVAPARVRSERKGGAPLVLTPALRVAGRDAQAEDAADDSRAQPADEDFEAHPLPDAGDGALRTRLKETIAELESAITHHDEEWEPDGSEPAPVMDWSGTRPEDTPFLSRRHLGPVNSGRRQAQPREMRSAAAEAQQPPRTPATPSDGVPAATTTDGAHLQADAERRALQAAMRAAPPPEPAAAPATPAPSADVPPAPAPSAPDTTAHGSAAAGPQPAAAAVDEEMLRRLITEVLREELRGPLGDRITGNLRKLVRREIFRALASGEFD